MLIALGIILTIIALFFTDYVSMGRVPHGKRLERCQASPNYNKTGFTNLEPTVLITDNAKRKGIKSVLWSFIFSSKNGLKPKTPLESYPVNREEIEKAVRQGQDKVIWFGHSSYLLIIGGKTILVDPVFYHGSPISFINRPFKGTSNFRIHDLPFIDFLVYTHDHYDHLDYKAAKKLKHKSGMTIVPLGVGSHLEYWGFKPEKVVELDWGESYSQALDGHIPNHMEGTDSQEVERFTFNCTPARHFSGRSFKMNRTLWASFVLQTPSKCIYIGGDGGYGKHFKEIGQKYSIDWAFIENGQYNKRWAYIHTLPDQLHCVMEDLGARHYVTVHHSKFSLSQHKWDEPLGNELKAAEQSGKSLTVLQIGNPTDLK